MRSIEAAILFVLLTVQNFGQSFGKGRANYFTFPDTTNTTHTKKKYSPAQKSQLLLNSALDLNRHNNNENKRKTNTRSKINVSQA